MSLNWAITPQKQPKTFVAWKIKVQLIRVNRLFEKFCLGCMILSNQARSSWLKNIDTEAVLYRREANLVSIRYTWHFTIHCRSSHSQPWQKHPEPLNCTSCTAKIWQIFWLSLVFWVQSISYHIIISFFSSHDLFSDLFIESHFCTPPLFFK